jgi:hypothetical protein
VQLVLIAIGGLQILGAVAGLAALGWAIFHKSSWPPVYFFSAAGFHLVTIAGAWRLMQMGSFGRPISALSQLVQLTTWGVSSKAIRCLAGPQLALVWSRGVVSFTVGGGGGVSVMPPPTGALGRAPAFEWSTLVTAGESALFRSLTLNLFPLLALVAIGVSWWLDRRRLREFTEDAADLGKAGAARHRLRTPAR